MYALLGKKAAPRVIPPPPSGKRVETPVEVDAELIEDEPVAETSSPSELEPEPASAEAPSAEAPSTEASDATPASSETSPAESEAAELSNDEPTAPSGELKTKLPPPPLPPPPRSLARPPATLAPPVSTRASGTSIPPIAFDNMPAPSVLRPKRALRFGLLSSGVLGILLISGLVVRNGLGTSGGKLAKGASGTLVISVAGPSGRPIDSPRILADGKLACESSPCRISSLNQGTHFVQVEAPGYGKTAPRAIFVDAEKEAAAHIELSPEAASNQALTPVRAPSNAPAEQASAADVDVDSLPIHASAKNASAATTMKKSGSESASLVTDGTVSINTTPSARVVIDGKPMGSTPLSGVRLHPGPHSIVFIHPELGRKATAVTVTPGGTSSVNVRL